MRPNALRTVLNRVSGLISSGGQKKRITAADVEEMVELVCAHSAISETAEGGSWETSLDETQDAAELIAAVAKRLGEAWCNDECDFSNVTIAMTRLQTALHRLLRNRTKVTPLQTDAYSVLLTLPPGEQHTLGLAITQHAFSASGWATELLHPRSLDSIIQYMDEQLIGETRFDLICVSWSNGDLRDRFVHMVETIRGHFGDSCPVIIAGGHSADVNAPLLASLGVRNASDHGHSAVTLAGVMLKSAQAGVSGAMRKLAG
ncbi:MAG: hypothetical protein AAF724_17575 [Pseudomonadota bacterium]